MQYLTSFPGLFALIYGGHLIAYFGLGLALVWWNNRHPERRIQKDRRGEERAALEIRRSLVSLVPISALMAGGIWAQLNGWSLFAPAELTFVNVALWFGVTILLYDAWFYWAHRLMHTRMLYRFHRVHHGSLAPTVWSNYSDDPLDAAIHEGFLLVGPLLLPIPPVVLVAHRLLDHVNGQIGHSG
ncbi:MAG: sterol desaturase family protein, partial [Pseudomonadota bacterium]